MPEMAFRFGRADEGDMLPGRRGWHAKSILHKIDWFMPRKTQNGGALADPPEKPARYAKRRYENAAVAPKRRHAGRMGSHRDTTAASRRPM